MALNTKCRLSCFQNPCIPGLINRFEFSTLPINHRKPTSLSVSVKWAGKVLYLSFERQLVFAWIMREMQAFLCGFSWKRWICCIFQAKLFQFRWRLCYSTKERLRPNSNCSPVWFLCFFIGNTSNTFSTFVYLKTLYLLYHCDMVVFIFVSSHLFNSVQTPVKITDKLNLNIDLCVCVCVCGGREGGRGVKERETDNILFSCVGQWVYLCLQNGFLGCFTPATRRWCQFGLEWWFRLWIKPV